MTTTGAEINVYEVIFVVVLIFPNCFVVKANKTPRQEHFLHTG